MEGGTLREDITGDYPALQFILEGQCGRARAAKLRLPHHTTHTPIFMPVGTQGTIKGLTASQVEALGPGIVLGNTYHLGHRPGPAVLLEAGGLHRFMRWPRNLLTDSGGFQMVSLSELAHVTEEGVHFTSPHDGSPMMLTPEESMHIQNCIGADIMMALDDVIHSSTTGERVEEAMHRTIRWLDRCIEAHKRPNDQNLFGIVQGGLDPDLRTQCLTEMVKRDLPGFAIGGLSGGESKHKFWRVVSQCCKGLPDNKPRYLMGVGYAVDLVVCVALGVDMFDCVYPCRTARFGTALVRTGALQLTRGSFSADFARLEEDCPCSTCANYTRAYLSTVAGKHSIGAQLLTVHNIAFQMRLMNDMHDSIKDGSFPQFVRKFLAVYYGDQEYPTWVCEALADAGIDLPAKPPAN